MLAAYLPAHEIPPLSSSPPSRIFSLLADESKAEAKSAERRAAICLLACDKSILFADVRDTISDPRTFAAREHTHARTHVQRMRMVTDRQMHTSAQTMAQRMGIPWCMI